MTNTEARAKCIDAVAKILYSKYADRREKFYLAEWWTEATAAFDSLHGLAFVCSPEVTQEMVDCIENALLDSRIDRQGLDPRFHYSEEDFRRIDARAVFAAMSAAGDLTNQPEKKP